MDWTQFIAPLAGGALIGIAASGMLLLTGRIAGISGIFGGLLKPQGGDLDWRLAFVGGLVVGGLLLVAMAPETIAISQHRGIVTTVIGGLVVGFGVRMGNGCTSGHGVCGIGRFSKRSIIATSTFMATGVATASIIHLMGWGAA